MKLLLSLSLILSFVISADDHETPEYKYEPEANKAEYFIGTYNQGKDLMICCLVWQICKVGRRTGWRL